MWKKALSVANAQWHSYMRLLNSTFAVIFLGGVHSTSDPALLAEKSILILRSFPNTISKHGFVRIAEESQLLADICQLYQDAEQHMQIPVLSLYERERTKVRIPITEGKGQWNIRRNGKYMVRYSFLTTNDMCDGNINQLADAEATTTGSAMEDTFELSGTHEELCKFEQSHGQPSTNVREWLRSVLSKESLQPVHRRMSPG